MKINRIIKIPGNLLSRIHAVKEYYLPGIIIFIVLFVISTVMNSDFSYMGNKSDKLADIVIKYFLFTIIVQFVKIIIFYIIAGAALNCYFLTSLKLLQRKFNLFRTNAERKIVLLSGLGILIIVFSFFSEKLIENPQLYTENFASHSSVFKSYLYFLTDHMNPALFSVIIYFVFIVTLVPFIISIDLKKLSEKIFSIKGSLSASSSKSVILLLFLLGVIYLLYRNDIIFFNSAKNTPNILIISSDALRPDHMSFNGYGKNTTPNIDAFAKDSLQIKGGITTVPRTFPAWVSILTSRYPLSHGIAHMFPRTRERSVKFDTAATYLGGQGYKTAVISDFAGDIFPRIDLGFEKVSAPDMNTTTLIKQMILEKQAFLLPFITNKLGLFVFPEIRDFTKLSFPAILTEETIKEIDASRGKPFFIVTFYSITHFPFSSPYPYYKKFADPGYKGQHKYFKDRVLQLDNSNAAKLATDDSSADNEQVNALYDGCLNLFDKEFAKIIEHLESNDLLDNTIVIITSDHGENLYEREFGMGHGEHLKGNYSLEVPLIVHYPKMNHEAGTLNAAFSTIDIMPTVFDIAGLKIPEYFDGVSVFKKRKNADIAFTADPDAYCETGIWFDNDKSSPLFFHHQRIDYPDITGISEIDFTYENEAVIAQKYQNIVNGAKYRAIYSGKYKLIYIPLVSGAKFELYDFLNDPDNQKDLSGIRKDVLENMKKQFYNFIDRQSSGNFIIKNGLLFPAFRDPVF